MDSLVCPKLEGFMRLTQKLIPNMRKGRKNLCPVCGGRSSKRSLCQPCVKQNFVQIACTRSIKLERNEYFYGSLRKPQRWHRKNESVDCEPIRRKKIERGKKDMVNRKNSLEEKLNYIVKPLRDIDRNFERKTSSRSSTTEKYRRTKETDRRDINEITHNQNEGAPLCYYAYVSPPYQQKYNNSEDGNTMPSHRFAGRRLHELFEPVSIQDQENWKLLLEPKSDDQQEEQSWTEAEDIKNPYNQESESILTPEDQQDTPATQALNEPHIKEEIPIINESSGTVGNSNLGMLISNDLDRIEPRQCNACYCKEEDETAVRNKQLKKKVTFDLLKIAFKTQLILNSLFRHFKQAVESEKVREVPEILDKTGNSSGRVGEDNWTSGKGSKISVDSFMFPNTPGPVLWEHEKGQDDRDSEKPLVKNPKNAGGDSFAPFSTEKRKMQTTRVLLKLPSARPNESAATLSWESRFFDIERESHSWSDEELRVLSDGNENGCPARRFYSEHSNVFHCRQEEPRNTSLNRTRSIPERQLDFESSIEGGRYNSAETEKSNLVDLDGFESVLPENRAMSSEVSWSNQKSLLDLVFTAREPDIRPSLLPLPESPEPDLIRFPTPEHSTEGLTPDQMRKDAISQTNLSSRHLDQELNLLHRAFLDQLAHFSQQLVESCKIFGHSWQTTFLAELVEHFRSACDIVSAIMGCIEPSLERLDQLEIISNNISTCLAELRTHPHSFIGDCADHDIATLMSSLPAIECATTSASTWV